MTAELPQELDVVIRRLRAAYEEALALTSGIEEPLVKFAATGLLGDALQAMQEQVAEMRALILTRMYEADEPGSRSLARLGDRVGIGKARAGQLVQRGKAAHRKDGEQT